MIDSDEAGQIHDFSPPFPRRMTYDGEPRRSAHRDDSQIYSGNNKFAGREHSEKSVVLYRPPPAQTRSGLDRDRPHGVSSVHRSTGSESLKQMIHREKRNASALSQATPLSYIGRPLNFGGALTSSTSTRGGQAGALGGDGRHQPQAPELLSRACQKRGFNPRFQVHEMRGGSNPLFTCDVQILDITVEGNKKFSSLQDARIHAAEQGLDIIKNGHLSTRTTTGQAPLGKRSTGFRAKFDTRLDDNVVRAVYARLDQLLPGRAYALQKNWNLPGSELQLHVPGGWIGDDLKIHMKPNWSITFKPIELLAVCQVCQVFGPASFHTRAKCPLWVKCPRPARSPVGLAPIGYPGSQDAKGPGTPVSIPRRGTGCDNPNLDPLTARPSPPFKEESMEDAPPVNNCVALALPEQTHHNREAKLVRDIQELVGTATTSSDNQDPRVKTAFLEGIALGARLAATAPGPVNNRSRSRSPDRRSSQATHELGDQWGVVTRHPLHTSSDYYTPRYRQRSPLREKPRSSNSTRGDTEEAGDKASKRPESVRAASASGDRGSGQGHDFPRRR